MSTLSPSRSEPASFFGLGTPSDDGLSVVVEQIQLDGSKALVWADADYATKTSGNAGIGTVTGILNPATSTAIVPDSAGTITLPSSMLPPLVVDGLASTSTTSVLSANQGRVLSSRDVASLNIVGQTLTLSRNDASVLTATIPTSTTPPTPVVDNLLSTSATDALSANQGRLLTAQDVASLGIVGQTLTLTRNGAPSLTATLPTPPATAVVDGLASTSATAALSANQGRLLNAKDIAGVNVVGQTLTLTKVDNTTFTATLPSGGTTTPVINNLLSTSATDALSANQGRVLNNNAIAGINVTGQTLTLTKNDNSTFTATLPSGGTTTPVVDNLISTSATSALSANQGRVLENKSIASIGIVGQTLTLVKTDNSTFAATLPAPPTIVNNLLSTSGTDALSANQGRILNTQGIASIGIAGQTLTVTRNDSSTLTASIPATTIVDALNSSSPTSALSANQGRLLNVAIGNLSTTLATSASNGITKDGAGNFTLGGTLTAATTITASSTNTWAWAGLVADAAPTDVLTLTAGGLMRRTPFSSFASAASESIRGTYASPLTGAVTVGASDAVLLVANGSTSALPPANANTARNLTFVKPGAGSAVLSGSVNGQGSGFTLDQFDETINLKSDGATWVIR
jgi:hypothetical protein